MSAEQENQPPPAQPNAERKTLDDRAKMTELERIRHSAAHVMATAILRLWPEAQFAAGPPVENGFYYDVDLPHRISPEDFEKIEAEMKKEIKANNTFEKIIVTREQAIADSQSGRLGGLAERPGNVSKFKLGNLEAIPEGEPISYFKNGDFLDLCAGPHVMRTGNIGAFKLTHVAAAYYKGDEKGPQLQRIYGTAFKNKTAMDEYFKMIEEARRRDHRKIGAEMGLFAIDTEFVGPGMPLWLPKGTVLVEELEKLAKETEFAAGYVRVRTPHLARRKCIKPPATCRITRSQCFRRWNCVKTPHRRMKRGAHASRVLFPASRRKPRATQSIQNATCRTSSVRGRNTWSLSARCPDSPYHQRPATSF
jgi:threonyl-tRNA synthetase